MACYSKSIDRIKSGDRMMSELKRINIEEV
jgi:hypothetical protein